MILAGIFEFVAAVIAGSVHKKQDQLLVILLRQGAAARRAFLTALGKSFF
jgi:hypothetical protein